jgi:5-methylcytosine-specific restriction endonuclease McrA
VKRPDNAKERNLLKGAVRRVFSRSELRKAALARNQIQHHDTERPRVTAWVFCDHCGLVFPKYLADVDHIEPIVPLGSSLEEMTWTELVDRVFCDTVNLQVLCESCHDVKTQAENKERRRLKKERGTK